MFQHQQEPDTPATSLGYTGQMTDDNGLVYLRARYYNPVTATFLSRDPFPGYAHLALSRNGYSYVHNNPIRYNDPSGMVITIVGAAAGGAVVGGAIAAAFYVAALQGWCGCDTKRWAEDLSTKEVIDFVAQGAIWGGALAAGAAAGPVGATLTSAAGVTLGTISVAGGLADAQGRKKVTICNATMVIGGFAGIAGGGYGLWKNFNPAARQIGQWRAGGVRGIIGWLTGSSSSGNPAGTIDAPDGITNTEQQITPDEGQPNVPNDADLFDPDGIGGPITNQTNQFTQDQVALQELVYERTNGGRRPLPVDEAEIIMDWAQELDYPGFRASVGDVSSPSNWSANPVPHIHLPGAGDKGTHIEVQPGVKPR